MRARPVLRVGITPSRFLQDFQACPLWERAWKSCLGIVKIRRHARLEKRFLPKAGGLYPDHETRSCSAPLGSQAAAERNA